MTAEPCTTYSQRKRHYSSNLHHPATFAVGRIGETLCHQEAKDERRANDFNAEYGQRLIVVAELVECKKCARILAKEEN
jgi:hypothetical protein